MRILIVDDYPDEASSFAKMLSLHGHDTRSALSARDAVRVCESFTPDVVMTDISMPEVDGYHLVEVLRQTLPAKTFWIGMSGYPQLETRSRREGFDMHFTKPVRPESLFAALQKFAEAMMPSASMTTG